MPSPGVRPLTIKWNIEHPRPASNAIYLQLLSCTWREVERHPLHNDNTESFSFQSFLQHQRQDSHGWVCKECNASLCRTEHTPITVKETKGCILFHISTVTVQEFKRIYSLTRDMMSWGIWGMKHGFQVEEHDLAEWSCTLLTFITIYPLLHYRKTLGSREGYVYITDFSQHSCVGQGGEEEWFMTA